MTLAKSNLSTPYQDEAEDLTCYVSSAVTGKTFVDISENRASGPLLNTATDGSNYHVGPASAGARGLGVASYDAGVGELVRVQIKAKRIAQVTAGASITAGAQVEIGTGGKVITLATGIPVGKALTAATNNNDAQILLY
jgi:hypothetical protein